MTDPQLLLTASAVPKRTRSELRFPVYGLPNSVLAAKAVHEKGGGATTNDHLAAFLGYRSANNGAFLSRVAAAKLFGLIEGPPTRLTITPLAQKILMPIRLDSDPREALVEAFMRVPLYEAVYEEYRGKELPPEFGMKNALRTQFGVTPQRIDRAYRALMDSAEAAGFFEVRGSRSQLIMPTQARPASPASRDSADVSEPTREGFGGGGGEGGSPPPPVQSRDDLRNEYVSALIGLLRGQGAKGEVDPQLMARIEKLLDLAD